jgi:hypothetical protein
MKKKVIIQVATLKDLGQYRDGTPTPIIVLILRYLNKDALKLDQESNSGGGVGDAPPPFYFIGDIMVFESIINFLSSKKPQSIEPTQPTQPTQESREEKRVKRFRELADLKINELEKEKNELYAKCDELNKNLIEEASTYDFDRHFDGEFVIATSCIGTNENIKLRISAIESFKRSYDYSLEMNKPYKVRKSIYSRRHHYYNDELDELVECDHFKYTQHTKAGALSLITEHYYIENVSEAVIELKGISNSTYFVVINCFIAEDFMKRLKKEMEKHALGITEQPVPLKIR